MRSIYKDKHLLLFYPVVLEYNGNVSEEVSDICETMQNNFRAALEFRKDWYSTRETYIAFIFERDLQIALYTNNNLRTVDQISLAKSDTLKWLCLFTGSIQL